MARKLKTDLEKIIERDYETDKERILALNNEITGFLFTYAAGRRLLNGERALYEEKVINGFLEDLENNLTDREKVKKLINTAQAAEYLAHFESAEFLAFSLSRWRAKYFPDEQKDETSAVVPENATTTAAQEKDQSGRR